MSTLQYIPVGKISPHPENPRKDLGELAELSDSIKANGVLQNLTVVPILGEYSHEPLGSYRAVIGHRRLAAAKLAGLETVPCIVANMTEHEQLKTMIMENMQRADLTLIEQAGAFQMMMDLGDSINSIARDTGFSESTVRRRVKLMELDSKQLLDALQRGGTLMDFAELEQIENEVDKSDALNYIGTSNFRYYLRRIMDSQNARNNTPRWIEKLSVYGDQVQEINHMKSVYVERFMLQDDPDAHEMPERDPDEQYIFQLPNGGTYAFLYRLIDDSTSIVDEAKAERAQTLQMAQAELEEITKRCFDLRFNFIKKKAVTKKDVQAILNYYMRITSDRYLRLSYSAPKETLMDALMKLKLNGNEPNKQDEYRQERFRALIDSSPDTALLYIAYAMSGDGDNTRYYYSSWNEFPVYRKNKALDALYSMLEEIGYQISDEEMLQMSGKHPMMHLGKEYEDEDNVEDDDDEGLEDDEE